jgi:exodeoxyribonuclease VII small subunit
MKKEFEKDMKRLHEIASLMNDETLSLEEAMKLYSEASTLAQNCKADMAGAQLALKELFMGAEQ